MATTISFVLFLGIVVRCCLVTLVWTDGYLMFFVVCAGLALIAIFAMLGWNGFGMFWGLQKSGWSWILNGTDIGPAMTCNQMLKQMVYEASTAFNTAAPEASLVGNCDVEEAMNQVAYLHWGKLNQQLLSLFVQSKWFQTCLNINLVFGYSVFETEQDQSRGCLWLTFSPLAK